MFDKWEITVVGSGTMGHSIAQQYAVNGFHTTLVDTSMERLEKARERIADNIAALIELGEATELDMERAKLISYDTDIRNSVAKANLVVECIIEDANVKKELYALLDECCSSECIIASNTSALNIFEVAKDISNPQRLIIAHWFNPPHIMPLVEVVSGPKTSPETVNTVKSLLLKIGKKPALISQCVPGFIVNRLSCALLREALYMVSQGWTTAEDIDTAIVSTYGPRYAFEGHLELYDYVGWDVVKSVLGFMNPLLCSSTDLSPIVEDLVSKGHLGVKSGKGIKDYSNVDINQLQKERGIKIIKMLKAAKSLNNE